MIIGIHQPNYLPWIGFFRKIMYSDAFVFLDCVQFTKGGYQNRVKIKTPNGPLWLTQSILKSKRGFQRIKDVEFNNPDFSMKKHLKSIEANYRSAKYFDDLFPRLSEYYSSHCDLLLSDFNIGLVKLMCEYMGLGNRAFFKSSELDVCGKQTELLVSICKKIGATVYLSGQGGRGYQDDALFNVNKITVKYTDENHPVYKQCWKGFEAGLSIIDLCFNEGTDSKLVMETKR